MGWARRKWKGIKGYKKGDPRIKAGMVHLGSTTHIGGREGVVTGGIVGGWRRRRSL